MKKGSPDDSLSSACTVTTAELSCSTSHSQSSVLGGGRHMQLGAFPEDDGSSGFLVLRRSDISWKAPMKPKRDKEYHLNSQEKTSEDGPDDYMDAATLTTCSWDESSSNNPSEDFVFRNSPFRSPHSVKQTKQSRLSLRHHVRNPACDSPQTLAANRWDDSVSPDASKSTVSTMSRSAGSAAKKKLRVRVKASELAQLGLSPSALKAAQGTAESEKVQATLKKWLEAKKGSDTMEDLEDNKETKVHRGRRASLDSATDRTKERSKSLSKRGSATSAEVSKRSEAEGEEPFRKERSRSTGRQLASDVVCRQRSRSSRRRSNDDATGGINEKDLTGTLEAQPRRSRSYSRRRGNSSNNDSNNNNNDDDDESKSTRDIYTETNKEPPRPPRSRSIQRTSSNKDESSPAAPRKQPIESHNLKSGIGSSLHRRSRSQSRTTVEDRALSKVPDDEHDKETRTRSRSRVSRRSGRSDRLERHRSKSRARCPDERRAPVRSVSSVLRDVGISEQQLAKLQASGLVIATKQ